MAPETTQGQCAPLTYLKGLDLKNPRIASLDFRTATQNSHGEFDAFAEEIARVASGWLSTLHRPDEKGV